MEKSGDQLDRRRFVSRSAGLVAGLGCLGSVGSLEGLRAALAVAMTPQKPLLRPESLNAFLAQAQAARRGELISREATADLGAFLRRNFQVDGKCARLISTLSKEETASITAAVQQGLTGRNRLQIEVAEVDLSAVPASKIDVRANAVGDDAQLTTIRISDCGLCGK